MALQKKIPGVTFLSEGLAIHVRIHEIHEFIAISYVLWVELCPKRNRSKL